MCVILSLSFWCRCFVNLTNHLDDVGVVIALAGGGGGGVDHVLLPLRAAAQVVVEGVGSVKTVVVVVVCASFVGRGFILQFYHQAQEQVLTCFKSCFLTKLSSHILTYASRLKITKNKQKKESKTFESLLISLTILLFGLSSADGISWRRGISTRSWVRLPPPSDDLDRRECRSAFRV